jgi:hypothetical protein
MTAFYPRPLAAVKSALSPCDRIPSRLVSIWVEPDELPQLPREVGAYLDCDDAFDLFPMDCRDSARRIRWQHDPPGKEAVVLHGVAVCPQPSRSVFPA